MEHLQCFEEAFKVFGKRADIKELLNWVVINGASFERYIQFELGFYLNNLLRDKNMYVYPEKQRCDLPIYILEQPKKVDAKIELKTIANWYTRKKQFERIKEDIEKINQNEVSSYAIVFYFYAKPNRGKALTEWIVEQIDGGVGIEGMDAFKEVLYGEISKAVKEVNPNLKHGALETKIAFANEYFDILELGAYWVHKKVEP